jgi:hypothetical protein
VVPPATGPYRDIRANMEQTWPRPILGQVHPSRTFGARQAAQSLRKQRIRSVIAAAGGRCVPASRDGAKPMEDRNSLVLERLVRWAWARARSDRPLVDLRCTSHGPG